MLKDLSASFWPEGSLGILWMASAEGLIYLFIYLFILLRDYINKNDY